MIPLLLLLAAGGGWQVAHPCEGYGAWLPAVGGRPVYATCLHVPVTLWTCGPDVATPLPYALAVDGVAQSTGTWQRFSYEPRQFWTPTNGLVAYVTSGQVTLHTIGRHTVTVTVGGQTVTLPLTAGTTVVSPLDGTVSACPMVGRGPGASDRSRPGSRRGSRRRRS